MRIDALHQVRTVLAPACVAAWLFAAAAGPVRAGVNAWTPIGPEGGNVDALALHPARPNVLFAGSLGGGVFRSTDGGATWALASRGLTDFNVSALAVDPQSPTTLYAANGDGVAKSVNSGATWSLSGEAGYDLPAQSVVLAVDPHASSVVYAGSTVGLFQSLDGGQSWNPIVSEGGFPAVALDPARPGTVYAVVQFGSSHLLRSTDGGATWSEKDAGLPVAEIALVGDPPLVAGLGSPVQLAVDAGTIPSTVLIAYLDTNGGSHTWRSRDAGESWQPSGPGGVPLALGEGVIYAGAYKSSDHGVTWQPAAVPPQPAIALLSVPGSAATVLAGTAGEGVWKSGDAAASWRSASAGLTATSPQVVAIDPLRPQVLYAAVLDSVRGPGLLKSGDGGRHWRHVGPDGLLNVLLDQNTWRAANLAIDPATPTTLYCGNLTGGARSGDGGLTWEMLAGTVGDGACFEVDGLAIAPLASETVYATGGFGAGCACTAAKSTDGGQTWSCLGLPLTTAYGIWVAPSSPATLYAHGDYNRNGAATLGLFRSADGGATWRESDTGVALWKQGDLLNLAVDPTDPNRVLVSISNGFLNGWGLFRTTDGGTSWKQLPNVPSQNGPCTALAFDPQRPATVYALCWSGAYRSLDGGTSWSALHGNGQPVPNPFTGGLPFSTHGLLVVDPLQGGKLYAGTDSNGIYTYTVQ